VAQKGLGALLHANEEGAPSGGATKGASAGSTPSWQVICLDNASNNRIELVRLEKRFPQVRFLREEKNCGFACSHNRIMRAFPADFHAVLNPDLLLTSDFLAKLLGALEHNPRYGSAVGKLLWWNIGGAPERTNIIDSVGIGVSKSHAFCDIGQGKEDHGQYDVPEERFGGSGAAVVYRRSALEDSAYYGHAEERDVSQHAGLEFFDETMFLYKEDVDLAYRLLVTGHSCLSVPDALAWHARSLGKRRNRSRRPLQKRIFSAAHESLLLRKHALWWPRRIRLLTSLRQCERWLYLLICEPRVFFGARRLLQKLKIEAEKRRAATKHTIPFERIARLLH